MTATTVKTYTERTCWKCGEESLQPIAIKPVLAAKGDTSVFGREHSVCSKCGAKSVNAAQAKRNQTVNRRSRRASIRATNGRSVS
jgi:ribosomal protein S27AE